MRRPLAWVCVCLAVGGIACVSFSAQVAVWWGRVSYGRSTALPPWVRHLLSERPDLGEADVHAVMWGVVALMVGVLLSTGRARLIAWGSALAAGVLVEICQALFTTRSAEVTDVFGNLIGISVGAAVCLMIDRVRRRSTTDSRSGVMRP